MKIHRFVSIPLATGCLAALAACGTARDGGESPFASLRKSTSAAMNAIPKPDLPDQLANLMPGRKIKVVEAREADLKELKTGDQLASEYRRDRARKLWAFGGPFLFTEPALPEAGGEMDGGVLPPRTSPMR